MLQRKVSRDLQILPQPCGDSYGSRTRLYKSACASRRLGDRHRRYLSWQWPKTTQYRWYACRHPWRTQPRLSPSNLNLWLYTLKVQNSYNTKRDNSVRICIFVNILSYIVFVAFPKRNEQTENLGESFEGNINNGEEKSESGSPENDGRDIPGNRRGGDVSENVRGSAKGQIVENPAENPFAS